MGTSTNFANLSAIGTAGTVPTEVSGVVRDFLVTGNHSNASNKIQWWEVSMTLLFGKLVINNQIVRNFRFWR